MDMQKTFLITEKMYAINLDVRWVNKDHFSTQKKVLIVSGGQRGNRKSSNNWFEDKRKHIMS